MSVAGTAKACAAYRNHAARLGTVCRHLSHGETAPNRVAIGSHCCSLVNWSRLNWANPVASYVRRPRCTVVASTAHSTMPTHGCPGARRRGRLTASPPGTRTISRSSPTSSIRRHGIGSAVETRKSGVIVLRRPRHPCGRAGISTAGGCSANRPRCSVMTTKGCQTPWASLRATRLTRRSAARNLVSKANGGRAVHGERPPGKTGLDKHVARGGGRVGAKGFRLLPAIRIAVVILMGDGAPIGSALEAPDTLPWRERDPVHRVGGPEPIPVPDRIPTKPLPIGVVEIHPSVSSGGMPYQVLGEVPVPAHAEPPR